ncbi:hypothetical protein BJ508DRAFT_334013 [Ascobolus immersus RN42]|uniref:Uncharacterized protein n=1 Tax=Ascobolus immersus RN42 TaxID=1160509 RepID=A0A3N4HJQ8_ASCIM|nr:hypothetical protein BJ508DRAFT_334013 [Ascobolus immersus RN42]
MVNLRRPTQKADSASTRQVEQDISKDLLPDTCGQKLMHAVIKLRPSPPVNDAALRQLKNVKRTWAALFAEDCDWVPYDSSKHQDYVPLPVSEYWDSELVYTVLAVHDCGTHEVGDMFFQIGGTFFLYIGVNEHEVELHEPEVYVLGQLGDEEEIIASLIDVALRPDL